MLVNFNFFFFFLTATPVFLDISTHITQCCTFLVKSYVHIISGMPLKKQKSSKVIKILEESLKDFFTKR